MLVKLLVPATLLIMLLVEIIALVVCASPVNDLVRIVTQQVNLLVCILESIAPFAHVYLAVWK